MSDDDPANAELSFREYSGDAGDGIDLADREYAVYRCGECANVVLAMRDSVGEVTCHDEPMERVTDCELDVRPPDVRHVLLDAFGLPKAGLDVCLCVIGDGPLAPDELADRLDYDESTVRKYLNDLVEFGLLEKSQLNRESGGFVNVYHSIDLEQMHRRTMVGFLAWAGEAASLVEEANLIKKEYREDNPDDGLEEVFWEQFSDERPAQEST